jgi:large subunit ribosomal protein L25
MVELPATKRTGQEKPQALRAVGRVPAVFYGRKEKSVSVSVSAVDFAKAFAAAGESTVVSLKGDWGVHDVLIHEIDRHPVTDEVRHVDFYVLEKDRMVKVRVPLSFTGVSPAVKDMGGTLVKVLHSLEIEALPKNLPQGLSVDISSLATLESQIFAKDVVLPEGVSLVERPQEVVASIAEYKEEVVETPMDISQIEVEKKGKVEEEGAEGAAAAEAGKPAAKKEEKK